MIDLNVHPYNQDHAGFSNSMGDVSQKSIDNMRKSTVTEDDYYQAQELATHQLKPIYEKIVSEILNAGIGGIVVNRDVSRDLRKVQRQVMR